MYRIAVIGEFEDIAYFGTIGVETFFSNSRKEAEKLIKRLSKNGYAVIFVTEEYYSAGIFESELLPAVVPLDSGNSSIGADRLSEYVRRAIGSDMIFDG